MTPLTLDQLIEALNTLRESCPEVAGKPVQMLVPADSDGLVRRPQIDCFDQTEGLMISLDSGETETSCVS